MKKSNKMLIIIISIIFVLALIAIFTIIPKQKKVDDSFSYDTQQRLGSEKAPVYIVEFSDFKCPACRVFEQRILPRLEQDYITSNDVQFYLVNMPFLGPDSSTAAMIGEAIYNQNPKAFWTYYKKVYENQGPESEQWANETFLFQLIEKEIPEVDINKLKANMQSHDYKKDIEADLKVAEKNHVDGTPSIYINGKAFDKPFDYDAMKKTIEKELKKANE